MGLNHGFITQSEWFSLIYNNYQDWEYEVDEKFGIPVYQIEGTISEDKSESLAGPFTMTVAKDTGVLLGLDTEGMFIKVKDIKINQNISDDVFQMDLADAEEISKEDWNPYGLIDEEKTGGVDTSGE